MKKPKFLPIVFVGLGIALGYAAASGSIRRVNWLNASSHTTPHANAQSSPSAQGGSCCGDSISKEEQLAVASHNEFVSTNLKKSGGKPNFCIIWGDDVGQSNISAYTRGLMGYKTPNIDRIATEGLLFTDYYGEQSCTAGRASFITGQHGLRTGLTKVGLPGATIGLRAEDPTIAELLKPLGYATAQIGKNHIGDRTNFFPRFTVLMNFTATSTT